MGFGELARGFRKRYGFGLRFAAERMGYSASYLSRIEHGHERAGAPVIERMVRVYHLTPDDRDALYVAAERIPSEVKAALLRPGAFVEVRGWKR